MVSRTRRCVSGSKPLVLAVAFALAACGGGGGGGGGDGADRAEAPTIPPAGTNTPDPAPAPSPAPVPPPVTSNPSLPTPNSVFTSFTGEGTSVEYIGRSRPSLIGGFFNRPPPPIGYDGIQATAPKATITGRLIPLQPRSLQAVQEIIREAAENNRIVAVASWGFAPSIFALGKSRIASFAVAAQRGDTTFIVAAASASDGHDLTFGFSKSRGNTIVAVATNSRNGQLAEDGITCPRHARFHEITCIKVDMSRGKWVPGPEEYRGLSSFSSASLAAAKLAGYAAILYEAFPTESGHGLADVIKGGVNRNGVFRLADALTNRGLADIGFEPFVFASENRNDAGGVDACASRLCTSMARKNRNDAGGVDAWPVMAGWTRRALAGSSGSLPLTRGNSGRKAFPSLIAFGTLDDAHSAGVVARSRAVGVEVAWKGLSWGLLAERDGFLGKRSRSVLGGTSGRWTWMGWNGSAEIDGWIFGIGLEAGVGVANARHSDIVADYDTLATTAWMLRAERKVEGIQAWASVHQPPRVERARIRLRHGEGTVRERKGRELRWTSGIRAGGWTFTLGAVQDPSHDARRKTETSAGLVWRMGW